jgi:CDP-6-deoxy-D-xylo-4-hexulose-3-dehydrase
MKNYTWPLMKNSLNLSDRLKLITFILNNDRYTNGEMVKKFESKWSDWLGSKYSLMVSSGSTANTLIISSIKDFYGWKNGDKVLVPSCTWVTNISPVFQAGLTPIFCDINLKNFSFDIEHMKSISNIYPDIKGIFVTHLLGYSADNEKYSEIFPNAIILDDVCESHGCKSPNGLKRGSDSLGASFSFYFGHHMTTIEGGMVCTNNEELYELMRMKRSHGLARESNNFEKFSKEYPDIQSQYLFMTDGYNFRSTELNAVLGINQLKRLDSMIKIRRDNFSLFVKIIEENTSKFHSVYFQEGNSNFAFPLIARTPQLMIKLKAELKLNGIEYRPIVGGNLLRQPFLKNYNFGVIKDSYNADLLNDNGLYVGNNHFVTQSDVIKLANIFDNI